ncbi:MAG TPA: GGDEF domain-containing protein [Croceibacterium sp.]|nr:GGDEF domain-containing protein [Croceibacterium sp.]
MARFTGERRRELLDAIGRFLLDNDLAVNPSTLTLAWQAFSGASPSLHRRISGRLESGQRITQQWLDEIAPDRGDALEHGDLKLLFDELDKGVQQFARSTTAARSATREYHSDLDRHVLELEGAGRAEDVVSRLTLLARAMAERTRRAEQDLLLREQEARSLRRQLGKAVRHAERDHLTGLPNRRAFEAELERQHAEAAAGKEPLSLAFCDIDHFKHINDTHGHEAGDRVLKLIAQVLAKSSNDNCHVSRHGGEEFVLLFRGLTPTEAKARLDTAREDLASRRLLNRETREPFGTITFSAGVASVFAHPDPREALKAADDALYRAKQTGRNQVLVA